MEYKKICIEEFLKKYNEITIDESEFEKFKEALQILLKTNPSESEEHQKNNITAFLKNVYDYSINTKGNIDAAIYEHERVAVIIEAKALKNKTEFPSDNTLESKAFYESILYFLKEYHHNRNNKIKHIILCTFKEFYIIDAKEYLAFADNKEIYELYEGTRKTKANTALNQSNDYFYKNLPSILQKSNASITYTHFSFKEDKPEEELRNIVKLLSPTCLLKQITLQTSTLNRNFYEELLYILGLQEVKDNGGGAESLFKQAV